MKLTFLEVLLKLIPLYTVRNNSMIGFHAVRVTNLPLSVVEKVYITKFTANRAARKLDMIENQRLLEAMKAFGIED